MVAQLTNYVITIKGFSETAKILCCKVKVKHFIHHCMDPCMCLHSIIQYNSTVVGTTKV